MSTLSSSRAKPQPHRVEVGVGADVGLVLPRAARSPAARRAGRRRAGSGSPRAAAAGPPAPGSGSREIACSATRKDSDGVGDLLGEVLELGLQRLDLSRYSPALRLPANARPRVTSSAYSRSPPTGSPLASRVTRNPIGPQESAEICRSRVALDVGIGGQDDLGDGAVVEPGHQLADAQLLGTDAVERRDRAAEHVVAAPELAGALDRDDVLGLLDDADQGGVAARVAADPALLGLGDVAADLAEPAPWPSSRPGRRRAGVRRPGRLASRWKAIRWAPLGPTPGSRPSSSIRSWRTPSYTEAAGPTRARAAAGPPPSAAQAAGQRAERLWASASARALASR